VVEDYIKTSIGPRAAVSDLVKTAMVLARFGPRLPALVEAALIKQADPEAEQAEHGKRRSWLWAGVALAVGLTIGAAVAASV
jgi:ubiquinone biosynthesis protein